METQKAYKFSEITYQKLEEIADFRLVKDWSVFDEWFSYKHEIEENDIEFLLKLIETHKYNLNYYTERQLQAQFITPLMFNINFNTDSYKSWYEYDLSGVVNNCKLSGSPDFMIATGERIPEKPYFFIQEFKKSKTISNPDCQVLTAMALAMEINKTEEIKGCYNIGRLWAFIILEKISDGKYKYYESESFDSLKINDLKKIYTYLQAVKHKYCK